MAREKANSPLQAQATQLETSHEQKKAAAGFVCRFHIKVDLFYCASISCYANGTDNTQPNA